jgi:sarcosine oxidase subunit beta
VRAETIIIGGGVAGASVAYHLAERGRSDVIVLERAASLGMGSTGKATGGIRAQFETDINIKQSLYSLDFFRDWEFDAEYDPKGYIFLATNNIHLEYLDRSGERQRELGYDGVHLVTQAEIAEMVPGMNVEDILGGSFGPRDGFINPLAILEGFIVGASQRGVRALTGVDVKKIITENGRVTGVVTADGSIDCENVVIAAGAWSTPLAASVGIELPVVPQRRQIVWAHAPEPLPADLPMVIDLKDGFHFRPAKDFEHGASATDPNDVLFAWADPDEPASFSTQFDESFLEQVGPRAQYRAPFLNGSRIVYEKCRAGLYENTPDHHSILGGCEVEGLYFACGFSGHGVMHSPATGRALAEIILDGDASFLDVSSLSIERFAKGELLHETAFI